MLPAYQLQGELAIPVHTYMQNCPHTHAPGGANIRASSCPKVPCAIIAVASVGPFLPGVDNSIFTHGNYSRILFLKRESVLFIGTCTRYSLMSRKLPKKRLMGQFPEPKGAQTFRVCMCICVCSVYYQPNSSLWGGPLSRPPAGCALGSVGNPFDRVWPD